MPRARSNLNRSRASPWQNLHDRDRINAGDADASAADCSDKQRGSGQNSWMPAVTVFGYENVSITLYLTLQPGDRCCRIGVAARSRALRFLVTHDEAKWKVRVDYRFDTAQRLTRQPSEAAAHAPGKSGIADPLNAS